MENCLNKENKNYNNQHRDIANDSLNSKTDFQTDQNNSKGICTNKKNYSSIILTHVGKHDNNQTNNTEIKTRNNLKKDFTSSSSYGAYYNFRK
jgi:hypothetical protein